MPRRKATPTPAEDELPGLGALDQDPQPVAARRGPGRPRKATTTGARGPGKIPARNASGRIMSKPQMIAKANAEIYTYIVMAHGVWSLRDPDCAAATEDQLGPLAEKITALLARNDTALSLVANSGLVGDVVQLGAILWPMFRVIWGAHGPNGTGHGDRQEFDAERYPAFAR